MNLEDLRKNIDSIDDEIISLVEKRMDTAAQIAAYKKENNLPILNAGRERQILQSIAERTRPETRNYMRVLYSLMFELSRAYQGKLLNTNSEMFENIMNAIENTPKLFPSDAKVACQGVEGAYSQIACEKMFKNPEIMYMSNFDAVFSAVESGLCKYGVLPIENSTAGSVNKVYDLMTKHNFNIVRSARIKINHCLLAKKGTALSSVREIFSHEQAISQCSEFLSSLKGVKVTRCENTAMAAKMVSESDRTDVAALSSKSCAELYGLDCLESVVQDSQNNHTRFVCISKNLEIYPGADKTSLMLVAPHKPGALYKTLARFYALGINLIKLESRPIPERDFEFMFYFDLETSVYSEEFAQLICELDAISEDFRYFGSYSEVI